MHAPAVSARPHGLRPLLGWPRLRFTLLCSIALGLLLGIGLGGGPVLMLFRSVPLGVTLMLVFGVFGQWPRRLPRWIERWVLQVIAVAAAVPLATALFVVLTTARGEPLFFSDSDAMGAYLRLTGAALLIAPWTALGALVRQREAFARHQALAFALERSEFERQAVEARLRLVHAQVAPHFLFNTLANVQAMVEAGSPRAPAVLRSLIAYLRAAVPRLDEAETLLGEELDLVRAYLELMHMRMPDRLQFALHVDEGVRGLRCPRMTLLTLVENAVRHGIDPSIEGGRIDVHARRHESRCVLRVTDTGGGPGGPEGLGIGLGTGLATLQERLRLAFDGDANLRVSALEPHGVSAELDFPVRELGR